jgi:hypothetical protein
MIQELKQMVVERLTVYQKHSRRLPDRVYVYRDGVSEVLDPVRSKYPKLTYALQGQFETVIHEELPQILEAFKRFDTKERSTAYRPKLTIIICGKRHHARFFPTDGTNADRNGNTRPGTVVDKGVTDVYVHLGPSYWKHS